MRGLKKEYILGRNNINIILYNEEFLKIVFNNIYY